MPETAAVPHRAWADLPPDRPPPGPRRSWARVLVPLALVAILWLVGWRELAFVVLVVATVVGIATTFSESARRLIERAFEAIARFVGQVLTVVLLGIVQLVIFTPVSLLARVLRRDPLDPLAARGAPTSRWVDRTAADRSVPQRQYANERYRARAAGDDVAVGSARWIRGLVGGVVLLLVADVALGSLLTALDDDDDGDQVDLSAFDFDPLEQEALQDQESAEAVFAAMLQIGIGRPDPFLGWRFPADYGFESPEVNIVEGIRASSPPPLDSADPPEVWFLGGSTMYGSGQGDDATIASAAVRLAAESGTSIRATNLGHPAYANWQQVLLLQEHLLDGGRPDVVVFYDGFNDLTLQTQFGVHHEPTHLSFRDDPTGVAAETSEESVASTVGEWWGDHSAVALAYDRVADLFRDEPSIQVVDRDDAPPIETIDPIAAADAALAIHRRGIEQVETLAGAYGFEALFFWQPYLYTRDNRTPAEEDLVGLPGYDTDVWFPMTDRARAGLREPIIDLGDVLDDEPTSLYWDFVHTNERGAELVAAAMVPHLIELVG